MFKKEKVRFTYKNGFTKAEFKNVSDKHLDILKRDICKEQIRRKESHLFGKPEKMTFGQKLRRFIHRLARAADYKIDTVVVNCIVGSEQAASVDYIGLVSDIDH
ncbi:MAG: hypothetical protein VZS12_11825 [Ruminococcus bromii]|nr:hypothetical protein [Ruminococcus bromii]